jgi:hypothetical protein
MIKRGEGPSLMILELSFGYFPTAADRFGLTRSRSFLGLLQACEWKKRSIEALVKHAHDDTSKKSHFTFWKAPHDTL